MIAFCMRGKQASLSSFKHNATFHLYYKRSDGQGSAKITVL